MSILEFQISAAAFLSIQRNAPRSTTFCLPVPPPPETVQLLIDRLDFGGNALRHNVPDGFPIFYQEGADRTGVPNAASGYRTQIAQEVTAHVTRLDEVLAHPNGTPTLVPVVGTAVFDLDLFIPADGDVWYRIAFDRIEPGPLPMPVPLPVTVRCSVSPCASKSAGEA